MRAKRWASTAVLALTVLTLPGAAPGAPLSPAAAGTPAPAAVRNWPVPGPTVLRGWEPPPAPYARGHRGVDLAAPSGTPVRAVAPGRVSFAGRVAGRGVLSIELKNAGTPPLRTTYEPITPGVKKGAEVTAGQVVGTVTGPTPHCPRACLHWGLRRGDTYLNPLSLLNRVPSRLLPVLDVPLP
ncbi:M23 family metallopeptidase [Streptomyces sp. NPDC057806]|uniref:M23 family metallopeptidase n=1 Tax=Streptomyces sp. NPDC057806 TaxID=3346255 RepID=UPI0036D1916E